MTEAQGEYEDTAELHELFMVEPWRRLRPSLAATFGALPASATIVDMGAGSGAGLVTLAAVCRAQLVAVEPSPTMRAMLVARILGDGGTGRDALRQRATVLAAGVPVAFAQMPDAIDGFLAMHMLGHLEAHTRTAMLRELAQRTRFGGAGLVTIARGAPSEDAAPVRASTTLGAHRYDVEWQPDGTSTYEVHAGDRLVRTVSSRTDFRTVLVDDVERAVGDLCVIEEIEPGLLRLTRGA